MDVRRKSTGQILVLDGGAKIGAGGEADVFAVPGAEDLVAKIYHRPERQQARKIEAMLSSGPENMNNVSTRVAIAWPIDILLTANGTRSFVGFVMPRASGQRCIIEVYNPRNRKNLDPLFNYACLMRAAGNLAGAVAALHRNNCIIGDLNETNTWVGRDSRITLIDCDSFQVRDPRSGETFRCNVGKAEYTPPELQGERFSEVYRERQHDLFGLAVLVFQLLMEGTNPFAGVPFNKNEESVVGERIARGQFPYGTKAVSYRPPPFAPPFSILHPKLQTFFVKCFEAGHQRPSERPAAFAWESVLREVGMRLKTCARNRNHLYCDHLNSCPWCERTKLLGGRDPFPLTRPPPPKKVQRPPAPKVTNGNLNPATIVTPGARKATQTLSQVGGCVFWIIVIVVGLSIQRACSPDNRKDPGESAPARPTPVYKASPSVTVAPVTGFGKVEWPDGRKLAHPDNYVRTGIINVRRNDFLALRSGPGTRFTAVAQIPPTATDILAFDKDQVWDGDTWWCPVAWHGNFGYVGRGYLP